MNDDSFILLIVLSIFILIGIISFAGGYLYGLDKAEDNNKIKELCQNDIFYYSDSNYSKCHELGVNRLNATR